MLLFPRMSLLARLLIPLLLVIGFLVGGYAIWSSRYFTQHIEAEFQQRIIFASAMVRPPLTKAVWDLFEEGADEVLSGLSRLDGFTYGVVTDADGQVFASIGERVPDLPNQKEIVMPLFWSDQTYLGEFRFGVSRTSISLATSAWRLNALFLAGVVFVLSALAIAKIAKSAMDVDASRIEARRKKEEQFERDAATSIAKVVSACARGDFSRRLNAAEKTGVYREMSEGLNAIGEVAEHGLEEIRTAIQALAQGDFQHKIEQTHQGVFAEISEAMNHTAGKLGSTIGTVIKAGETVASSSSHIAVSTADIATRTSETANTLEKVAVSLGDLSDFVDSTAASSERTNVSVARAVQDVALSSETLGRTRKAINEIKSSSSEISQIVSVIQGIAVQTNTLALNAGIEAVRAGDQGNSFGVIATEVRALSLRSAKAAEEIDKIIHHSQDAIETGVLSVGDCVVALDVVNTSTKEIAREIELVAGASQNQSERIGALHLALKALKNAMQETSAICSDTRQSTSELDRQVGELRDLASGLANQETRSTKRSVKLTDAA